MKRLIAFGLLLPLIALAQAATPTATVSWTAPTTNTDGSSITAALTYNLYAGTSCTSMSKLVSGITTVSTVVTSPTTLAPGTTVCFAVTAVANGVESAQSNTATTVIPYSTPGAPGQITVVVH